MDGFKDVFISYGRAESKRFAQRLADRLQAEGLSVWLDNNEIPIAVDFQQQIDEGIDSAHNFVFVIAPHAVRSVYCRKELDLAVERYKRIIPVMHVEPQDEQTWSQLPPTLSRLNWLPMKERPDYGRPLDEWEPIDDFETGVEGLVKLIRSHESYVQRHTDLLRQALHWERNQRATDHLLIGEERRRAEEWLLTRFGKELPPCEPSPLHCAYVCESKKNGENMQSNVCVSSSEADAQMRGVIINSLARHAVTTWTHRDVESGGAFEAQVFQGIERSDNVLFFLSHASAQSEWCRKELAHAKRFNKRIVCLLLEPVPRKERPEEVRGLQPIDFTDNNEERKRGRSEKSDFEQDIDDILTAINDEKRYYEQHRMLLVQALRWERHGHTPSILLRGYNLQNAQSWLKLGLRRSKVDHPPIALHESFINASATQAGSQRAEAFVSYSRTDGDFARKLNEALQIAGKATWFDQESISEGVDFQREIYAGIESADNFLFILSPKSVASPYCADEVDYAVRLGKRIVPVLWHETDPAAMPEALSSIQWIDFRADFHTAFGLLVRTLDTDRDHVQEHARWQERALEWDRKGQSQDLLLRGEEFERAETWMNATFEYNKKPQPTAVQKDFIQTSKEAILALQAKELATARRLKRQLYFSRILLLVAFVLLIFAIVGFFSVKTARQKAEKNLELAKYNEDLAKENERIAEERARQAERAEEAQKIALENTKEAQREALEEAEKARQAEQLAEEQSMLAQQRADEAQRAQFDANEQAFKARQQKVQADKARIEAENARQNMARAQTEAQYYLYTFNAKEVAIRSINIQEDDTLQALLALTAHQLEAYAHSQILPERGYRPEAEVLEALQKAYLPFGGDEVARGPVWTMDVSPDGSLAYTRGDGFIRVGALKEALPGKMPHLVADKELPLMSDETLKKELDKQLSKGSDIGEINANPEARAFVRSIAAHPGGQLYAYGNGAGLVAMYSAEEAEPRLLYNHGGKSAMRVRFLPDLNWLVSTGKDRTAFFYDCSAGTPLDTLRLPSVAHEAIAVKRSVYLASESGALARLSADGGQIDQPSELYRYWSPLRSMAYSARQELLVAGAANGRLLLFDVEKNARTAQPIRLKKHHKGVVTSVAFSADGRWMASAGLEGSVLLWDLSGERSEWSRLAPVEVDNAGRKVFSVAFSADSRYLLFGDNERLRIRPLEPQSAYRKLQALVGERQLSQEDWDYYIKGDVERPQSSQYDRYEPTR